METQVDTTPETRGFLLSEIDNTPVLDLAAGCETLRVAVYDVLSEHHSTQEINSYNHRYPIQLVARHRDEIKRDGAEVDDELMSKLQVALTEAGKDGERIFAQRKAQGLVELADIPKLFKVGDEVARSGDDIIAGKLISINLVAGFFSTHVEARVAVIHGAGGTPQSGHFVFNMRGFVGLKNIADLTLQPLSEETKKQLQRRGELFLKFLPIGSYAHYDGSLIQDSWFGPQEFRADGRVVLDSKSFQRVDGNQWRQTKQGSGIEDIDDNSDSVSDEVDVTPDMTWMCFPHLYGFSMTAKRWGRVAVKHLKPIQWRKDAFEKLVLPEDQKRMVHALVKHHGHGIGDLIDGKGGGCIFLLHGEPGGGKTLLSESVAEILERPLYSVSVGELGTDPETLESKLRSILDVATVWNAVILLDEADIFLEERNQQDIERNAMVGVFLRQLEYHNGVLFMTTNRVRNIDRAFYSRISVAIRFEAADDEKRTKIWTNLLDYAKLNITWAEGLGKMDVNGRQIKNAIRLAQTLAVSEGRDVAYKDLVEAVDQALSFQHSMDQGRAEP